MALPAGRKGVLPSELTPEGKIRNSASPYVLPTASAETLGGVKVGSGLSIADGVLSAEGGASIGVYETNVTGVTISAGEILIGPAFKAPDALVGKSIIGAVVVYDGYICCLGVGRASDPVAATDWLYPVYASPRAYTGENFKLKILYI